MNTAKKATSGNRGDRVRSDCWVELTRKKAPPPLIRLESKVSSMYGDSIKGEIEKMLSFFKQAALTVNLTDLGALPFVISARMESALRKLDPGLESRYLPDPHGSLAKSGRDRQRRSRLYLPGDQPKFFLNAALHQPDGIILDLEDSVSPERKADARILVRNALLAVDFKGAERMVRINQLPMGLEDLEEVVPVFPNLILIPKVETPGQVREVEEKILAIQKSENRDFGKEPYLMPIIESARGVMNCFQIAQASRRIVALAIGLEDYTADLGTRRTKEGRESLFARQMLVNAARAAGIQAIDTVFSDVADMEGLRQSVLEAKGLGFDGKGCIHPRQIAVINEAFLPDEEEISRARKIVLAYEEARDRGLGVVSIGSKMIDPPVVKRALRVIQLAENAGRLKPNWREENV